jgi:hypothetical protein
MYISPLQGIVVNLVNILNFSFLILAFQMIYYVREPLPGLNKVLFVLGGYVAATAYLQFFGFVEFAGTAEFGELIRVSGAPGSKQHLSLILSVFAVYFLHNLFLKMSILTLTMFVFVLFSLFITYTRVGYVFFFIVIFFWFVLQGYYGKFTISVRFIVAGLVLLGLLLIVMSYLMPDAFEAFISRISMLDMSEYSNRLRFDAWIRGWEFYIDGCIVFSCDAGMASQIPGKLFSINVPHYENGHIQILINMGMVGWGLLMLLLLYPLYRVKRPREFSVMAATIICLFIYMFNEIVPVFVLISLVLISAADVGNVRGENASN